MKPGVPIIACLFLFRSLALWSQDAFSDIIDSCADEQDLELFLEKFPLKDYFTFPEDRSLPIRMSGKLPKRWCYRDEKEMTHFSGEARPGEFYVFQIGIYTPRNNLENIHLDIHGLVSGENKTIRREAFRCFNLGGIDKDGQKFDKKLDIPAGKIQPLWIGLYIPEDANGTYKGELIVSAAQVTPTTIEMDLEVNGTVIPANGTDDGWRMSRLQWLDSRIALDDSITQPYVPLEKEDLTISLLGRSVTLQGNGLPEKIDSFYSGSVTGIQTDPRSILSSPVRFIIESQDGILEWEPVDITFTRISEGIVEWQVKNRSEGIQYTCRGKIEFDGFCEFRISVEALQALEISDIRLEIPIRDDVARYMMGLGYQGGCRPDTLDWKWDKNKHQDAIWIGDVNAGIRCKLKGENYRRPLINVYYKYGKLNPPVSWDNSGKGGVKLREKPGEVILVAYSGNRKINAGDEFHFDLELLVTPLKTINPPRHFATRFIHRGTVEEMLDRAQSEGANVINIHHTKPLNPFINYPYYNESVDDFRDYITSAHGRNIKVKPYYTTRELTVNAPEFWAIWSLNGECVFPGPGEKVRTLIHKNGPDPWLTKNLQDHFIPAWVAQLTEGKFAGSKDLSVITTPDSRWNNFYLEGLHWMMNNLDIDGIYIDDTALDRETLKRARKILDRSKSDCIMDLHSWNHFNTHAGWTSCANLYMELFPYMDRIWFGEGFDYNSHPDYWLVEISGIPFGLMGEMLQGGGNQWRGMVYGMTNRIYQGISPVHVWDFMDRYDLGNAQLMGYWDMDNPVRTDNENILATTYLSPEFAVVSLGNFSGEDQNCTLEINWEALQMDKDNVSIYSPYIEQFQEEKEFGPGTRITVKGGEGWLIVIQKNEKKPVDIRS